MPLIKEDGTGLPNANSYANVADADAYHADHLYATTWTSATTTNKEKALAMATRFIDQSFQFNGLKLKPTQSLQWPRVRADDPDIGLDFPSDALPPDLVRACCELAREVILVDRSKERAGIGLTQLSITGATHFIYDKKDKARLLTEPVQLFLKKLGQSLEHTSGSARIQRA